MWLTAVSHEIYSQIVSSSKLVLLILAVGFYLWRQWTKELSIGEKQDKKTIRAKA